MTKSLMVFSFVCACGCESHTHMYTYYNTVSGSVDTRTFYRECVKTSSDQRKVFKTLPRYMYTSIEVSHQQSKNFDGLGTAIYKETITNLLVSFWNGFRYYPCSYLAVH